MKFIRSPLFRWWVIRHGGGCERHIWFHSHIAVRLARLPISLGMVPASRLLLKALRMVWQYTPGKVRQGNVRIQGRGIGGVDDQYCMMLSSNIYCVTSQHRSYIWWGFFCEVLTAEDKRIGVHKNALDSTVRNEIFLEMIDSNKQRSSACKEIIAACLFGLQWRLGQIKATEHLQIRVLLIAKLIV